MIRVLLADDQQLIREALAALLGLEVDLEIVGQVGSGDEVLGAVALLKPDVVLLDVQMPGTLLTDGIEAAAAIRDAGALSESGEPVRTLIVTTFGRPGYVRRALDGGATRPCMVVVDNLTRLFRPPLSPRLRPLGGSHDSCSAR